MGDCTYVYILDTPAKEFIILMLWRHSSTSVFAVAAGASLTQPLKGPLASPCPPRVPWGLVAPCMRQEGPQRLLPHRQSEA